MLNKSKLWVLIILLITAITLAPVFFNRISETYNAVRQIDLLDEENNSLKRDLKKLKEENERLQSQLQKQKLFTLEAKTGLVRIEDVDDTIVMELRYATDNNFTGQKLYPASVPLLQRGTANKLKSANDRFKKDGYRIKVWDAYRPLDVQKKFWELNPNRLYVANPAYGSKHNRGSAVDITLVDKLGNELEMPTEFDHFSERAWRSYAGNTPEAQRNMEYLGKIMEESGFIANSTEWWHFDDNAWKSYPVLNIQLEDFILE